MTLNEVARLRPCAGIDPKVRNIIAERWPELLSKDRTRKEALNGLATLGGGISVCAFRSSIHPTKPQTPHHEVMSDGSCEPTHHVGFPRRS
jgi:hypothetical protein